jgi:hypothetical protein
MPLFCSMRAAHRRAAWNFEIPVFWILLDFPCFSLNLGLSFACFSLFFLAFSPPNRDFSTG